MDKTERAGEHSLYDEAVVSDATIIGGERIVLHAERPQIAKRSVEARRAVVTRRAVTVRKVIEVDITHEELQIDYVPGSGLELSGNEQPESIIVRLRAEEIEIVKHVRVVEEVILSKRRVAETVPVSIDLRHEELEVIDVKPRLS